jgi:capsular polysaccharide biosynthesis protein
VELTELLQAIKKRWLFIAIVTAISGVVAGGFAAMQPPMYTATARGMVSVSNPQNRPPYALASGSQYILERMTSYAELGVTTPVLTPVVNDLNLQETPLSLSGRVTSQSVVGKAVLEVAVTYNDPKIAAKIADSTMTQIGRSISALENGNVQMVSFGAAVPPTEPSNRNALVTGMVAAAGGGALGCLIAVCLNLLAKRRRAGESEDLRDIVSVGWTRDD